METTHLTTGTRVRVTATDLTLAPAGTITTIVDLAPLAIKVGDSAIVIETTDVEAV